MIRENTTIVGYGLMGGSLAQSLRPHVAHLTIVDTDPEALAAAASVADRTLEALEVDTCHDELIILATPVRTILELVGKLAASQASGCMVFDLGSTKEKIGQAMEGLPGRFQALGGHPMCGKEQGGFAHASANLFEERTFVLCRNGRTGPAVESLVLQIVELVGATPVFLDAAVHDALVGATSHLPYLIAAGLVRVAAMSGDERTWHVTASGFRDTSRLAGSDPRMMLDILLTNAPAILSHLEKFQAELADVARWLRDQDVAELQAWLAQTRAEHARYQAIRGQR